MTSRTLAVLPVAASLALAGMVLPHLAALGQGVVESGEAYHHVDGSSDQLVALVAIPTAIVTGVTGRLAAAADRRRLGIVALVAAPFAAFILSEVIERVGGPSSVAIHAEPGVSQLAVTIVPLTALGLLLARLLVGGIRLFVQAIRRNRRSPSIARRTRSQPLPCAVPVVLRVPILASGYGGRAPPLHA